VGREPAGRRGGPHALLNALETLEEFHQREQKGVQAGVVQPAALAVDLNHTLVQRPQQLLETRQGLPEAAQRLVAAPGLVAYFGAHHAQGLIESVKVRAVLGGGRGTAAHFGMTGDVDLIVGTFSKAFASIGGFVAGDEAAIHWIQHLARSLIFSASPPAPNVAAALAALDVMEREPERVDRVNAIAARMRRDLRALGFDIGESETPIIPIFIGDSLDAMRAWRTLFDAGVYVNVAIPPAVPQGKALLRTSYMATHTDEQMDRVLETFATVGRALGLIG